MEVEMISADGEKNIKKIFLSKIKVAVEWEGRTPDDLAKAYEVAEEFDFTYSLSETLDSINSCVKSTDPEDRSIYEPLRIQANDLKTKVNGEAMKIMASIDRINGNDDSIKEQYIADVAKKFMRANKSDCVLIAPDLWLPSI